MLSVQQIEPVLPGVNWLQTFDVDELAPPHLLCHYKYAGVQMCYHNGDTVSNNLAMS